MEEAGAIRVMFSKRLRSADDDIDTVKCKNINVFINKYTLHNNMNKISRYYLVSKRFTNNVLSVNPTYQKRLFNFRE